VSDIEEVRIDRVLSLEDAGAFHGHLGPFLVIGYRVGRYIVEKLEPIDEFDLFISVAIPLKTPYSCILDGIQCSTKCTLGKWNINWQESNEFLIKAKNRNTGKILKVWLNKEVIEEAENCQDIAGLARILKEVSISEIVEREEEI